MSKRKKRKNYVSGYLDGRKVKIYLRDGDGAGSVAPSHGPIKMTLGTRHQSTMWCVVFSHLMHETFEAVCIIRQYRWVKMDEVWADQLRECRIALSHDDFDYVSNATADFVREVQHDLYKMMERREKTA